MTDKQENRFSMALNVQALLNANAGIIQTPAAFQLAKAELDDIIAAISGAAQIQTKNTKGNAEDKEQAAENAIDSALAIIGPAQSYAVATGNNSLNQSLNYTVTGFKRLRDTALTDTLSLIKGIVLQNAAALEDYGITAAQIDAFNELIGTYNNLITTPRSAITTKSAATKAIAAEFKKFPSIFKRLDGFVAAKKQTDAAFYNQYQSARVVVNNKSKSKKQTIPEAA